MKTLTRHSLRFALGTWLSRISGLVRESVLSAVFGASASLDAFNIAFRIPNLLRELLAEGALGSAFTKIYSKVAAQDPERAPLVLLDSLRFVFFLSLLVCTLGIFFAPELVHLMTLLSDQPGAEIFQQRTAALTRLLFPFIGFASLGAVAMGALTEKGKFFETALAPIAFNVASVGGVIFFPAVFRAIFPEHFISSFGSVEVLALAVGTLVGGIFQLAFQMRFFASRMLASVWLFPRTFFTSEIREMLKLMIPMVTAAAGAQINVVVNTNYAASLPYGSITCLNFAFRLVQLPLGMFGVAVGLAALPSLTKKIAACGGIITKDISADMFHALELVVKLLLPCTLFCIVADQHLIRLIYQAGAFSDEDTLRTALALQGYAVGLCSFGLIKVFNSFYYAVGRTSFPMMVSLFSILVNAVGNAILVQRYGIRGLSTMSSITLTLNSLLLFLGAYRLGLRVPLRIAGKSLGTLVLAGGLYLILGLWVLKFMNSFQPLEFGLSRVWNAKLESMLFLGVQGLLVGGIFGVMFGPKFRPARRKI